MKTIYDEAIEELQDYINEYGMDYYDTKHYPITIKALKVEELLKQYQVLAHDYEVLSNNKDRTKLGLLIFAVEEGKRVIKQLEEELK